jgi:hypothetical protein
LQFVDHDRDCLFNRGRTTAQDVVISVTKLKYWHSTTGIIEFDEEVMDLPVARYKAGSFNLAPGGHRYMDAFVVSANGEWWFGFVERGDRIYLRPYGHGSYKADIVATAANMKAVAGTIKWYCDLTLTGTRPLV